MKILLKVNEGQTSMRWYDLNFNDVSTLTTVKNFLNELRGYEEKFINLSKEIKNYNEELSEKICDDICIKFDKVFINLNKVPSMKFFDGTFNYYEEKNEYIRYLEKYYGELLELKNKYKYTRYQTEEIENKIKSTIDTFKIWTNQIPQKDNIIKCLGDKYNHCISHPDDFYGCILDVEEREERKKECIYKAAREAAGFTVDSDSLLNDFKKEVLDNTLDKTLDDKCGICRDPLKNGHALCRPFECIHLFHCDCIDKWLYTYEQDSCPKCRAGKYDPKKIDSSNSSFGRWYTSSSVPFGVDIKVGDVVKVGKDKKLKKSVPPGVRLKKGHRKVVCEFGSGGTIKKGSMFMVDGITSDGSFVRGRMI